LALYFELIPFLVSIATTYKLGADGMDLPRTPDGYVLTKEDGEKFILTPNDAWEEFSGDLHLAAY
jgi:hypothetical protein